MGFLQSLFKEPDIDTLSDRKDVKGLIKALLKDDFHSPSAAYCLGDLEDPRATPALLKMLHSNTTATVYRSAVALARIKAEIPVDLRNLVIEQLPNVFDVQDGVKNEYDEKVQRYHSKVTRDAMAAADMLDQLGWLPENNPESAFYWLIRNQPEKCVPIGRPANKALYLFMDDFVIDERIARAYLDISRSDPDDMEYQANVVNKFFRNLDANSEATYDWIADYFRWLGIYYKNAIKAFLPPNLVALTASKQHNQNPHIRKNARALLEILAEKSETARSVLNRWPAEL